MVSQIRAGKEVKEMPYIAPEIIETVKRIDLLTYLQRYAPQELVHCSGNTYTTRSHDSLKISNGKWCWWSRDIGGRSALDYLIKVRGYSFLEAVELLAERMPALPVVSEGAEEKPKIRKLLLPPPYKNAEQVLAYLKRRGIDSSILCACVEQGILYESREHHNAVFVGKDRKGVPKYAALEGTSDVRFKGEANGSDKQYAFSIPAKVHPIGTQVHVFESPIDLLSHATLQLLEGQDWRQEHLLSLSGVYRTARNRSESRLPVALRRYLTDYPEVRCVITHLDNDRTGESARAVITETLPADYVLRHELPRQGKDVNDLLCIQRGLPVMERKKEQKERREV